MQNHGDGCTDTLVLGLVLELVLVLVLVLGPVVMCSKEYGK
jgi:hypothetical protein